AARFKSPDDFRGLPFLLVGNHLPGMTAFWAGPSETLADGLRSRPGAGEFLPNSFPDWYDLPHA
ncbi:MAG: hypothetical protein ABMA26_08655, partial [Limisphaerales bacterium]